MAGDPWEWFRWAEYDLEAGKFLFNGRRNFYASFMGYTQRAEIRTIRKIMIPLDIISLTPGGLDNQSFLNPDYVRNG